MTITGPSPNSNTTAIMETTNIIPTQEIHERLNHRCGQNIPLKHLAILMECFGQPITEANIEAFLKYAWE